MDQLLKRELTKIGVLFLIGVSLLTLFIFQGFSSGVTWSGFGFRDFWIMLTFIFFPIGIAYGWRNMTGLFSIIRSADNPPHGKYGYTTVMITIVNLSIAVVVFFALGWLFGVYHAVKKLQYLKNNSIVQ